MVNQLPTITSELGRPLVLFSIRLLAKSLLSLAVLLFLALSTFLHIHCVPIYNRNTANSPHLTRTPHDTNASWHSIVNNTTIPPCAWFFVSLYIGLYVFVSLYMAVYVACFCITVYGCICCMFLYHCICCTLLFNYVNSVFLLLC
jgi:hypothetical protein